MNYMSLISVSDAAMKLDQVNATGPFVQKVTSMYSASGITMPGKLNATAQNFDTYRVA